MSLYLKDEVPGSPHAGIQWKGTDVCMDFQCECGANCHFDGMGAYVVQCPHCHQKWEMPYYVIPRKINDQTMSSLVDNFKMLEKDEDVSWSTPT